MHRDRNDRRRALLRQAVWLAAGSVAVLLTVRALLDEDALDALGAATTALRAAETALDDAAADIGAAAEVQGGQDAGPAESDPMSDAARGAEWAARAAGRASTEARTVVTRVAGTCACSNPVRSRRLWRPCGRCVTLPER